eukprot:s223_g61.t1
MQRAGAVFPGKIGPRMWLLQTDFSGGSSDSPSGQTQRSGSGASALPSGQTQRLSGSSGLPSGQTHDPESASDFRQTQEPESASSGFASGRTQRPGGSGSSDLPVGQTQDTPSPTSSDSSTTNWVVNLNNSVFMTDAEIPDPTESCANLLVPREPGGGQLHPAVLRHVNGTCEPCVFQASTRGCRHGNHCSYCHLNHAPPVVDRRVRKRTRDKITARLQNLLRPPVDLEAAHPELQKEAVHHIFGRAMIRDYLEDPDPANFFNARLQVQ